MSFNICNKLFGSLLIDFNFFELTIWAGMILSIWVNNFIKKGLDLAKHQGFYPHEYMSNFEMFYSSLTSKNSDK